MGYFAHLQLPTRQVLRGPQFNRLRSGIALPASCAVLTALGTGSARIAPPLPPALTNPSAGHPYSRRKAYIELMPEIPLRLRRALLRLCHSERAKRVELRSSDEHSESESRRKSSTALRMTAGSNISS